MKDVDSYTFNSNQLSMISPQILDTQFQKMQALEERHQYMRKEIFDYYKEEALINRRANIEIRKYEIKSQMDEERILRVEEKKADIHIKKNMLTEAVILTQEGEFIKKQEYFQEKPKEYSFANFRITTSPVLYTCSSLAGEILSVPVTMQSQKQLVLYLDMLIDNAGYYWRKFRSVGISIKKRRKEKQDVIFDIVQILRGLADNVELPLKRGFYKTQAGILCYADKDNLIWKDVSDYAK